MQIGFYCDVDMLPEGINFISATQRDETTWHYHKFTEIAFVEKGSGYHYMGDRRYVFKAGDLFIINSDIPHNFVPFEEMTVSNILFLPDFIDLSQIMCPAFREITREHLLSYALEDEETFNRICLPPQLLQHVMGLYRTMLSEFEIKRDGYLQMLRLLLLQLFVYIFRGIKSRQEQGRADSDKMLFDQITSYITEHFSKNITLEEVCAMAFLSKSQFCRQFRDHTGSSFKEYTQNLRINEACRLLAGTDRRIAEIARTVGYQDPKYFAEIFKRRLHVSPARYREENQKPAL